jgi:probable rRNA maturation factor
VTPPRARATFSGSLGRVATRARFAKDLARVARLASEAAGRPFDLSVALLSDREIAAMNREWLGHAGATDVLSFPLSSPFERRQVGALAVGVETARREAASRGHAPYHELMLYVAHGVLHLLGHDDAEPSSRARMRAAEGAFLARLGLPSVFGGASPGRAEPGRRRGARAGRRGR